MKLQERNIIRSRRSISRDLGTLHITRKKVNRIVDHHHTSDSILRFCTQYKLCKENIVCIDETSFVIGDCGRFGYSNRGTRINVPVSKTLRCEKYTVVMAIMSNGILYHDVIRGNCNKSRFLEFIEAAQFPQNTSLLMDNVAFHHSKEVVDAIHQKGCIPFYIPSYSPRFNAIENLFGTMKPIYRHHRPAITADVIDHEASIHWTIAMFKHADFTPYFEHVSNIIDEAFDMASLGVEVYGYDS